MSHLPPHIAISDSVWLKGQDPVPPVYAPADYRSPCDALSTNVNIVNLIYTYIL